MKNQSILLRFLFMLAVAVGILGAGLIWYGRYSSRAFPAILANQTYLAPDQTKTALFRDTGKRDVFTIQEAETGKVVFDGRLEEPLYSLLSGEESLRKGDFSLFSEPGVYKLACGKYVSDPFEILAEPPKDLLADLLRFFYLQRCGCEVEDEDFGHEACHTAEAVIYGTEETLEVSGGWHDAGDYGRYTTAGCQAAADLLYAYLLGPELFGDDLGLPLSGNGVPDLLDEVRYELEWLLKMQARSGGVYHKVTAKAHADTVMPQEDTAQLFVTPVSSLATADFCGVMALAAEVYQEDDAEFSSACLSAAQRAWKWLSVNRDFLFEDPADIKTGAYSDDEDEDERFWAAAQLWRVTENETCRLEAKKYAAYLPNTAKALYANLAILTKPGITEAIPLYRQARQTWVERAQELWVTSGSDPYGICLGEFLWGSNARAASGGFVLKEAADLVNSEAYESTAWRCADYLLGENPLNLCYVTGQGSRSPQSPHHRPSRALGKPMPGMLVGGPDDRLDDDAVKKKKKGAAPMTCYLDNEKSYSTNEVTIYWNSSLVLLLTSLWAA